MKSIVRPTTITVFTITAAAAAFALEHMGSLPALIVIAPGYVVQAWLFEIGRALGGPGYRGTMVGVSALFWTLVIFGAMAAVRWLRRETAYLCTRTGNHG